MPNHDFTLYAIWVSVYTVTYEKNFEVKTPPMLEFSKAVGEPLTIADAAGITAPEGKQFVEWNTLATGLGTGYDPGDLISMPNNDLTLYAIWEDVTYELTYDLNGGDGDAPAGALLVFGEEFTIAEPTGMTPPAGKQFKEWNAAADGRGSSYTPGMTGIMPDDDFTLYAIWVSVYTVTYEKNFEVKSPPMLEFSKAVGEPLTIADATGMTAPDGKQFVEWNTLATGLGTGYDPGDVISMPNHDFTLYAIWVSVYTVTYEKNLEFKSPPMLEFSKAVGESLTIADAEGITAPDGKQFKEWNTLATGLGTGYDPEDVIPMPNNDLTLYAIWEDIPLYEVIVVNGTIIGSDTNRFAAGEEVSIKADISEGLVFDGWSASGVILDYPGNANTSFLMPANAVTVTATYEIETYSVTYDKGTYGTGDGDGDTKTHGISLTLKGEMFERTGHRQTGWSLSADGTVKAYELNVLYTVDSKVTLYPFWTAVYTLTVINGEGGGVFFAGDDVTITATPAASGEKFIGWTTSDLTLTDQEMVSISFVMPSKDVTVTANYATLPTGEYAISVQNDGNGTANATATSATAGTKITLTAVPNTGYTFKEWEVISGDVTITGNEFTMPGENVTVRAVFEVITYTLTYDLNTGTGTAPTESNKAAGAAFPAAAITGMIAPDGKQFKQWNTSADGSGTAYAPGVTVTMPASAITLYAIWEDIPAYALTYDLNTGTGTAPAGSNRVAGAAFPAAAITGITAPDGKQFKQWNTSADGSGTAYAPGATVTMPASAITLYAIWEDIVATGDPEGDGGSGGGIDTIVIIAVVAVIAIAGGGAAVYFLVIRKP